MRHFRFCCLLLCALLLKSCELPDVHPFTKATTNMAAVLTGGLQQVVADVQASNALYTSATEPSHPDTSAVQQLRATAGRFVAVAQAFTHYAKALDTLAYAGEKRGQLIDRVFRASQELVDASKGFLGPVAPLSAPAKAALAALDRVATDLNKAHTIHSLRQLASPEQDTLIQRTARVLRLGLQAFQQLDEKTDLLASLYEPAADYQLNTKNYYAYAQRRQQLATARLAKIVSAEYWLLSNTHPNELAANLRYLSTPANDPLGVLAKAAAQHAPTLPALAQLEAFYRDLAVLPQAQYEAAETAYRSRHPGNAFLTKSAQLLDAWANSHHELQLLLRKADRVTRQDLISYAQVTQQLSEEVKALHEN